MLRRFGLVAAALLVASPVLAAGLTYPAAPRGTVTDTYFGTVVADPYRWLEDVDAPQTTAWVKAEGDLTRSYLDAIPQRAAIRADYRKLLDYEKLSAPFHQGPWWFFFRNSGLQNQSVLYVRRGENGTPRVLLDPNTLAADGTVALAGTSVTRDGRYMAYATQSSGADWQTWHVKTVATGHDLPDVLEWSKFSGATWVGDGGFYYEAYDKPASGNATLSALGVQKLFFHRLGTPQTADRLVYASTAHPDQFIGTGATEDERLYFFSTSKGDGNSLSWKRNGEPDTAFKPIFALDPNVHYNVVGHDGNRVYIETNAGAPRDRLVWIDVTDAKHALHEIVPQSADKLDDVALIGNRFYLVYLHDAHSAVRIADLQGRPVGSVELPGIGTVGTAAGAPSRPHRVLHLRGLHVPGDRLSLRHAHREEHGGGEAEGRLRPVALRHRADLRDARRTGRASRCSSRAARTCRSTEARRRSSTATAGSTSR